jgi:hypothetical protein
MLHIGEEVVVMSAPGRFKVVAVDGPLLTIENAQGLRKTVLEQNVRTLDKLPGK